VRIELIYHLSTEEYMERQVKRHPFKQWEVSIIKLEENTKTYYKVTRRIAQLSVAETKLFDSKDQAKQQFEAWLTD